MGARIKEATLDLAADPLAVLNARYRTSPPARTMPVMLWIAALVAMVEVDGVATAATTALDLLMAHHEPKA